MHSNINKTYLKPLQVHWLFPIALEARVCAGEWFIVHYLLPESVSESWLPLGIGELCSTIVLLCYASIPGKTLLLCPRLCACAVNALPRVKLLTNWLTLAPIMVSSSSASILDRLKAPDKSDRPGTKSNIRRSC